MRQIRERLGVGRLQFARALGYTGTDRNDETRIRRYENQSDRFPIPLYIARLAWLILRYRACTGSLPDFPEWSGYDFSHEPDEAHASQD